MEISLCILEPEEIVPEKDVAFSASVHGKLVRRKKESYVFDWKHVGEAS